MDLTPYRDDDKHSTLNVTDLILLTFQHLSTKTHFELKEMVKRVIQNFDGVKNLLGVDGVKPFPGLAYFSHFSPA